MSDIFVSYASEDRARAEAISKALEAEGWSVWWDRAIPAGRRFSDVIEEEIGKARCMVVLWSAVSVAKDWVVEEAENGKSGGILVPVFIEAVQPPRGFRQIEATDLSNWRGAGSDTAFRALCQNIASVAGAPQVAAASAAASGTQRVRGAADVVRAVQGQQPPAVPATPERSRNPRLWLIAGAVGILAAGTAIYLIQAPEGAPPKELGVIADRQSRENSKDGLMYVYIEPGKFTMGCSPDDNECPDDEKPPHEVAITQGFWLGQTPVTQDAYQRVMGSSPSRFKGSRLPVEETSWNDAEAYCNALGMRLPTEAEWEYAARAGSTGARYGNLDQIAWHSANHGRTTHEVGQKQPNAFGLYDMLGNVWQWVEDDWAAYPGGTVDACASCRVLRGGSWGSFPGHVRASDRYRGVTSYRGYDIGFRCAGELR